MVDKVRVLIVDDSAFFRNRIRQELERTGEITIAGEAENGREAVQMSAELCPDLITMDVSMPLMDGISAVRAIMRDHPINILMVSAPTSDGDPLLPGTVLIAPGGMQTLVERLGGRLRVRVEPGDGHLYKPSVDLLSESAARALDEAVQAVVLTVMGSDGALGARALKERGSSVWTQDQASSVVFGMPYAVATGGYSDRVIALDDMGAALRGLA